MDAKRKSALERAAIARTRAANHLKIFDSRWDYVSEFNSWLYKSNFLSEEKRIKQQRSDDGREVLWEIWRTIKFGSRFLKAYSFANSQRDAYNSVCWKLLQQRFTEPLQPTVRAQMDGAVPKESNQGLPAQESSQAGNVIITRDEGETETEVISKIDVTPYISSEEMFEFGNLTGRWMQLDTIPVTTGKFVGTTLATYFLPESLYKSGTNCAPNLIPFETFIYSNLDIDMKFIVNAQRFQCGKVIASVKFNSYQADSMQKTAQSALHRPHVVLDLSCNNEGTLHIPFRYHRGFVRNVRNDSNSVGIRPSKCASVYVQVLSQLRTGPQSATDMYITPYFRITRAKFAGMSYRVAVQMDVVEGVLKTAYVGSGLRESLLRAEKAMLQFGSSNNRDKPTTQEATIIIPRPRLNFPSGKGLSDAQPLRMNPSSLTSAKWIRAYEDEPKTMLDIARIWGLRNTFEWSGTDKANEELWSAVIDLSSRKYKGMAYDGTPTPCEYVAGMYAFNSGPPEFRFDFSSNDFHTGTVMITIEYGRPVVVNATACHKASTYSKVFHLGEQKTCSVTVPYIYDTIMRRSCGLTYQPDILPMAEDDTIKDRSLTVRAESKTLIRVSVVNELRPVSSTTQTIDVLVYMRAGPNTIFHGLKQMSYVCSREFSNKAPAIDSFPRDGYKKETPPLPADTPNALNRRRRIGRELKPKELQEVMWSRELPAAVRNMWNEYKPECIPDVVVPQMDTGEKEAQDSTADFSSGRLNLQLQTSDSQINIKDILRRPTLMVYRHTVKSVVEPRNETSGFFLPLMPPSRDMQYHPSQATEFSDLVGQTPQAAIMNLFRHWRGSQRYTIFFHSNIAEPIYIVHVPHTGTRLIGNQLVGSAARVDRPIIGTGLSTEVVLCNINPSVVVEMPYDTENNWSLTFEEDTQRNYSWRDKADSNCGHLVIVSPQDVQVTIWWSAGDDFEVSNFYGIPQCRMDDFLYAWSDAHARVQADDEGEDFQSKEGRTLSSTFSQVRGELHGLMKPKILTKIGLGAIPFVGPALTIGPTMASVEEFLEVGKQTAKQVGTSLEKVDQLTSTVQGLADMIQPIINSVMNLAGSSEGLSSYLDLWKERLMDLVVDLVNAWSMASWQLVGVTLCKFLFKVFVMPSVQISAWSQQLVAALSSLATGPIAQAPSEQSTLVGVFAGIVGLAMGTAIDARNYTSYIVEFSKMFFQTKGISYINQVIRFVQTTFDLIKNMVLEALGYVSPEAKALKLLSGKDIVLKQFITSAQTILNEANSNLLLHPSYRVKFWYTVTQAYQVQQVLIHTPPNVASPQLAKLCHEVIKVGNEKFVDLSCSPVRYEPYVICIEGAHGIGKSYMTEILVDKLLKKIGFKRNSSGWTYTRSPGSKFWSGLRDQPAIIYDDWLNLHDAELMAQQISELYQLKSTATFIPEMAHLEEKRIKANPMVVILLTNGAFPNSISNVAHHPSAIYRRRDIVLRADLKPDFKGRDLRSMTPQESETLSHLEFSVYKDSTDYRSLGNVKKPWHMVGDWLAAKFERYHKQEEINVRKRVNVLRDQLQIQASESFDFADPFSLLYQATESIMTDELSMNAWLPSEQLEAAVSQIVTQVRAFQQQPTIVTVPPEPDNIFTQWDCCPASWRELVSWFAKGVLVTPELWARIMKWTADGLMSMVTAVKELCSVPVRGECCVCNENVILTYTCLDSDNRHQICGMCWSNIQRLSPNVNCPICRSERVGSLFNAQDGFIASTIIWVSQLHENYTIPFLNFIARVFGGIRGRAMSKLALIGEVLVGLSSRSGINTRNMARHIGSIVTATCLHEDETWYDAVGFDQQTVELMQTSPTHVLAHSVVLPAMNNWRHTVRNHNNDILYGPPPAPTDSPQNIHGDYLIDERNYREGHTMEPLPSVIARTQADDDMSEWDEAVPDYQPRVEDEDILSRVQLNEIGFQSSRYVKTTRLPRCYHNVLVHNIEGLIYIDSQLEGPSWKLPYVINGETQYIIVPDCRCQHTCHWEDEANHRVFCEAYLEYRSGWIRRQQILFAGQLGEGAWELMKKIPRFARPEWATSEPMVVQDLRSDNWWEFLSEQWDKYKNIVLLCGMLATTMGTAYYTYSRMIGWFQMPEAQHDPNYNPEHQQFLRRPQRHIRAIREDIRRITPQSDDLLDVVQRYIMSNYVTLTITNSKGECIKRLTACGIFNHYAILPRHYVKRIQNYVLQGLTITISPCLVAWSGGNHESQVYTYDAKDFILAPDTDIALMKMPSSYRMFKDIRKFMIKDEDLERYLSSEGQIFVAPTRSNQVPQVVDIDIRGFQNSVLITDDEEKFEAFDVLNYGFSRMGACGSLVLTRKTQRPIVAMHCAGYGEGVYGEGYGVILTQEIFDKVITGEPVVAQFDDVELETLETAKILFDPETNVHYMGTVPVDKIPHIPQKTKIIPTLLHDRFGFKHYTEPCILSPRDERYTHQHSPLYWGARKHGQKTLDFPTTWLDRAEQVLWEGWIGPMKPVIIDPSRLTYERAIQGFEGLQYYDALSLNTSSGYPWNLGMNTTKDEYIQIDNDHVYIAAALRRELERKEQLRRQGIVPITMFCDTLKDERKLPEKVRKKGGTRVFCASPVDYTIAMRQNLLHFCAAFMKNRHRLMHAVGINVHGTEWSRIYKRLTRHGIDRFMAMDYSNFGPAFNARVAKVATNLMIRWTMENVRDVNRVELEALLYECVQSVHICSNTVYQQTCGSPSGAAITVVINSLVNLIYMIVAWEQLTRPTILRETIDIWREFREHVELIVYGDDLVATVSSKYSELFNMQTITTWFARYGITSTSAQKDVSQKKFLNNKEVTFLKRGWSPHPTRYGEYLAPLDLISINDITQWMWSVADYKLATRVNCESALLEAHSRGPKFYDIMKDKINKGLTQLKIEPILLTWEELDGKYYEEDLGLDLGLKW